MSRLLRVRIVAPLALLMLSAACSGSLPPQCTNSVIERVRSPDGAYIAEVEDQICESGRHSRYVYLVKNPAANEKAVARTLVIDVGAKREVDLAWPDGADTRLVISIESVPAGSATVKKETNTLGASITIIGM